MDSTGISVTMHSLNNLCVSFFKICSILDMFDHYPRGQLSNLFRFMRNSLLVLKLGMRMKKDSV